MSTVAMLLAFTAVLTDPMEWIYPDSKVEAVPAFEEIAVPKDGRISVNLLLNDLKVGEKVEYSASVEGDWFEMWSSPVEENSGSFYFTEPNDGGEVNPYVTRRAPFRVYDILRPLDDRGSFTPTNAIAALRFSLEASKFGVGEKEISFRLCQNECQQLKLRVRVFNVEGRVESNQMGGRFGGTGRDSKAFNYTNWMSLENMAERHGLKMWSDEHFAMIEKYVALAAANWQNTIWVSGHEIFLKDSEGHPTIFATNRCERLLEIVNRCGIRYIEGPHLCSREGSWTSTNLIESATWTRVDKAEATAALFGRCTQLYDFIVKHELKDRWLQHIMDEPVAINKDSFYRASAAIHRFMPGIPTLDAVEIEGFEGAMDIVVPKNKNWTEARDSFDFAMTNCGQKVWVYTCCAPGGKWMNRYLDHELLRPILMFPMADSFGITGYLHWGYNHWHSDPFEQSCIFNWSGHKGHTLPAGDTHVVYPGKDGRPWSSSRLEATREGMEDLGIFRRLREKDPEKAKELLAKITRAFNDYEKDVRKYREVRKAALEGAE